jgi:hypothetical protein
VRPAGVISVVSGLFGLMLVGVGIVYLVVACENLPGLLGPTPGDSAPRTPLGLAVLVIGSLVLAVTGFLAWRRRAD